MFNDFQPERSLRRVRERIDGQQAHVDFLKSEMYARALIVADQDATGRVDELCRVDYMAARERWEVAARDLADERTQAIANNTLALIHEIAEKPRHLEVVK